LSGKKTCGKIAAPIAICLPHCRHQAGSNFKGATVYAVFKKESLKTAALFTGTFGCPGDVPLMGAKNFDQIAALELIDGSRLGLVEGFTFGSVVLSGISSRRSLRLGR